MRQSLAPEAVHGVGEQHAWQRRVLECLATRKFAEWTFSSQLQHRLASSESQYILAPSPHSSHFLFASFAISSILRTRSVPNQSLKFYRSFLVYVSLIGVGRRRRRLCAFFIGRFLCKLLAGYRVKWVDHGCNEWSHYSFLFNYSFQFGKVTCTTKIYSICSSSDPINTT